jgi:serine/threonine protein kinase
MIGGRYVLVEIVGRGGQAQVFRAVDTHGGPDVAVKVLRHTFATDAGFRERFSREARVLATLKSPAALRVYGEFYLPDGRPALVTELLRGTTLGAQLDALEQSGRRLPIPGILAIMRAAAQALAEAHSIGVIHRDLKPDNLFLLEKESDGTRVKLLDFGFAKFLNMSALTAEGTVAGSPRYIAPEAWLGERNLTPAFDCYSLGAVVYHCLVGEPPFPEKGLAQLLPQVTKAERPIITKFRPDLSPKMNDWVARSLAISPKDRYSNVLTQLTELERALT